MPSLNLLILADIAWTDRVIPYLVVTLLIVLAVVIAYANYRNGMPFRIESSSSLAPEEVLDRLQSTFARDGWVLGYRDSGNLVMSIDRSASLGSTAALGCLSVWLGLLHLLISQRRITVEVSANTSAAGSLITTNGSRSGSYLTYVAWHLDQLPKGEDSTVNP